MFTSFLKRKVTEQHYDDSCEKMYGKNVYATILWKESHESQKTKTKAVARN